MATCSEYVPLYIKIHAESEPEREARAEVREEYSSVPDASDFTLIQPVGGVVREVEDEARTTGRPAGEYTCAGTAAAFDVNANKGKTARAVFATIAIIL